MESTWLASSNLEILAADWACTPPSVQRVFGHVLERVAALEAAVSGLCEENARLQEQTRRSSRNSLQPPSSDAPRTPPRPLRPAVIWQRTSVGSPSALGSQFIARMLTVTLTLRAQHRPVLAYLTTACEAARQGMPAPSLLPDLAVLEQESQLAIAA